MAQSGVDVNGLQKLKPVVPLADPGEFPGVAKVSHHWVIVVDLEHLSAKAAGDHQKPCRVVVAKILLLKYTLSDGEGWQSSQKDSEYRSMPAFRVLNKCVLHRVILLKFFHCTDKNIVLVFVASALGRHLDGGPQKTISVTVLAARLAGHSHVKFLQLETPAGKTSEGSFEFASQQSEWWSVTT